MLCSIDFNQFKIKSNKIALNNKINYQIQYQIYSSFKTNKVSVLFMRTIEWFKPFF